MSTDSRYEAILHRSLNVYWKRVFSPAATELTMQKIKLKPLLIFTGYLQRKFKFQPQRKSVIGKERDHVSWDGELRTLNFELSDSPGIYSSELVSPPHPYLLQYCLFPLLTIEINPSLSITTGEFP